MDAIKLCAFKWCEKPAAKNQKYCCKEHAPYGHMTGPDPNKKPKRIRKRLLP